MKGQDQGPSLGVSACLLGEAVRYDGGHKRDAGVLALVRHFQVRPLCPEADAGLGVPRPPVHLVRRDGALRAVGVEDEGLDVTGAVQDFARRFDVDNTVDGLVLKARSPSCAVDSAPVADEAPQAGLFTAHMRARRPWLPCIQEDQLRDLWARLHFAERAWIGYGLRSGRLGCLRPSWVYRLKGRGPGGMDQDPARSLEEALARPWQIDEIPRQSAFLEEDPRLSGPWRERLAVVSEGADPARHLALLLAALAALDGDGQGQDLFLDLADLPRTRRGEAAPC